VFYDISYFIIQTNRYLNNRIKYRRRTNEYLIKSFLSGVNFDNEKLNDPLYKLISLKIILMILTNLDNIYDKKNELLNTLSYYMEKAYLIRLIRKTIY